MMQFRLGSVGKARGKQSDVIFINLKEQCRGGIVARGELLTVLLAGAGEVGTCDG